MGGFRIIFVGGGIAGLAAAVALRGPGRDVTVIEASKMNKEIGALISLQPNATKIATKLGLDKYLAGRCPVMDGAFNIYRADGKKQMEIPNISSKYGAARMVYHRVDLHDALKEAALATEGRGKPAKILPSSRVVSVDCDKGIVTLKDGQTYTADLVIGADGIHSAVRTSLAGEDGTQPQPTGVTAYRLLLDTADLEKSNAIMTIINPRESATTMVVGHDRRIVMGPGRNGTLFGVVALVPDEHMHEKSPTDSWTSEGSEAKLLGSFVDFPPWIMELLSMSQEAPALYQLRDIDPLRTWVKGRTILIGDAAHAMLPTQGQGASQSFEDAEALQAFLADITADSSEAELAYALNEVFETRYSRASLIQSYSRQQAKPATEMGSQEVKLNPTEFMDYNCGYRGAKEWRQRMMALDEVPVIEATSRTAEVVV